MLLDSFMQILLCLLATAVGLTFVLSLVLTLDIRRGWKDRLVDILVSALTFGMFIVLVFESFDWVLGG